MQNTILNRLKKMIRTVYALPTAALIAESTLGGPGLGFDDRFIDDDFRPNVNDWFDDILTSDVPPGTWGEDTTLGAVSKDVADRSVPSDDDEYRAFMTGQVDAAFDDVVGAGAQRVDVDRRVEVAQAFNRALRRQLVLDVTVDDLEETRSLIISTIVRRRM